MRLHLVRVLVLAVASYGLVACGGGGGGGDGRHSVGGTVSGLKSSGLVLINNGADLLPVSTDGPFTFDKPVPVGGAYQIAVKTQPANGAQNCVVMNGTARGTVTSANVTSARVLCADIGRFAYILNAESSNASGWSIDAATGAPERFVGESISVLSIFHSPEWKVRVRRRRPRLRHQS